MSERISRAALAISTGLNRLVWGIACAFLILMLGLIIVQITGRYLLQDAPAWTEEAARYAMIWSGLLGGAAAYYDRVDPVIVKIGAQHSLWLRRASLWASSACTVVFLGPLIYFSPGFIERSMLRTTESLGWNLGLVVVIVPLYSSIILAQAILKLVAFETCPEPEQEESAQAEGS